jgi:hypothetical protein
MTYEECPLCKSRYWVGKHDELDEAKEELKTTLQRLRTERSGVK